MPRAQTKGVGRGGGHSPANVMKHLKGMGFPSEKKDMINHAKSLKADRDVLDELEKMDDKQYGSMSDVMKEFGAKHQRH